MNKQDESQDLPRCAREYIDLVIKKMRCRKKVRREVRCELIDHFIDAIADCETDKGRERCAEELLAGFGDVAMLGKLLGRGKKRCRPLWLKVLVRTMQVAGILLLCIIARGAYLSIGTPVISVDYVQWMNEHVRGGRSDDLNALPYYERAVELSTEVPDELKDVFSGLLPEQFTSEHWDAVEEFLFRDTEALDALRQGAAKPHYWNVYEGKTSKGGFLIWPLKCRAGLWLPWAGIRSLRRK